MASGLPVVATRVGGNAELIREGADGHLVAPRDAPALTDALLHLISDEPARRAMGRQARQRAVEKFSLREMVERYQKMYLQGIIETGRIASGPGNGQ
jgi:glycosyltransferase involved in cell wall biosynthesis